MKIAIDGPAGAGKSTIAKKLAKKLGYIYVDTGAMYRAMALYFLENNIDVTDEKEVSKNCDKVSIDIDYVDGAQQVILNGQNVTSKIREEIVGNTASVTSVYADVRTKLVSLQRDIANKRNVVMDGRDIGTVVLPDAELKIYLTASSTTRAERRALELEKKGEKADLAKIKEDIEDRDYRDMHRAISPLKRADDAHLIDSSDMNIDQVVDAISVLIK